MHLEKIWQGRCQLGESPVWDAQTDTLYWVDINGKKVYMLDYPTLEFRSWDMPMKIGSIALHANGGLIAALEDGFAEIDVDTGRLTWISKLLAEDSTVRFNDGKCDHQGRFWAASCDQQEQQPLGGLYCLHGSGKVSKHDEGFTVGNGIDWSLDSTTMYVTDSPARTIFQYDFNPETAELDNKRIFARINEAAGYPDGLTVDSEGYVWSAHWDGWQVTRYSPDGRVDLVLDLPVQRPTSCCFAGPDMDVLIVTTASNLSEMALQQSPDAGSVLALHVDVLGLDSCVYQGVYV